MSRSVSGPAFPSLWASLSDDTDLHNSHWA